MERIRVGADVGGTFTDLVFLDSQGGLGVRKVPSTTGDFGRAIVEALSRFLSDRRVPPQAIREVVHGTTVASNAILERKGARVGLVTTEGFRDVLEIRRVRLPKLYDITWQKPDPLVPRERRLEVTERVGPQGKVWIPFDVESARHAVARLKELEVDSVAVTFLHSYANAAHERAMGELLNGEFEHVSLSSEVLPELREYERTATTVIDAYVKPVVGRYLERLRDSLVGTGVTAPFLVMQSNGGVLSARGAARWPVHIIESGPAAGVVAAVAAGAATGRSDLVTFDMGGTTAKASVIENGRPHLSAEYEVGGGVSQGSRLIKGGGHLIRVPAIDIAEVGAGGGSIARVDVGGVLKVGPESAGADPGPACYARGGEAPTVTDANVVLGFLNPEFLVGGELRLDLSLAERALVSRIAEPLGLPLLEAALGVHRVANATMYRAIRAVTIERGRDPRAFTLVAFGGNGPVHAAGLARDLDIPRVLIPPAPGLFSSVGLLVSEIEHLYSRSLLADLARLSAETVEAILGETGEQARRDFAPEGFAESRVAIARSADVHYRKQIYELNLPLPDRPLRPSDLADLGQAFEAEHRRTYGYAIADERIEVVALKVRARGRRDNGSAFDWSRLAGPKPSRSQPDRLVCFGPEARPVRAPVVGRADIGEGWAAGPLVIEEYDSTVVVPPAARIRREAGGFLLMEP